RARVGSRPVYHVETAADVDARRAFAQMEIPSLRIDEKRVAESRRRSSAVALAARRALVPEVAVRANVLERIGERLERHDRGAVLDEDVARDLRRSVAAAHADAVTIEDIVRHGDRGAVDLDTGFRGSVDHDVRDVDAVAPLDRDADLGVDDREVRETRPGGARDRDDGKA